jgi:S1-C subfamily serine protease
MHYFRNLGQSFLCPLTVCLLIGTGAGVAAPKVPDIGAQPVKAAALESLLKSGPHALIRAFLVEPAYEDGKFKGFRVVQRTPHPVLADEGPVAVGDIIVSANGVRLETPGQFMAAWGKLKSVRQFSIVLLRAHKRIDLKWYLEESKPL